MADEPNHLISSLNALRSVFDQTWWKRLQAVIADTYEAGRVAGKNEAAAELREKIAGIINSDTPKNQAEPPVKSDESKRAPRGSVRPAVITALKSHPGKRPSEIAELTGLNENSIRGMLNFLAMEKPPVTEKRGELWFLAVHK